MDTVVSVLAYDEVMAAGTDEMTRSEDRDAAASDEVEVAVAVELEHSMVAFHHDDASAVDMGTIAADNTADIGAS